MTRYLPIDNPPPEGMYATPDRTAKGWQFAAHSDLSPGPIGVVTVAATEQTDREQVDVTLYVDPAWGSTMRARSRHFVDEPVAGDPCALQQVAATADLVEVDYLRLSVYGALGRRGLAAALREAAEMLEQADHRMPPPS
ncbi:hypothetical protein AB0C76_33085 [Kitasatospora sp. NPDC048722]|uniref:hypothetical protein n=1 Tax=Kitasatospora sp. NPDC048722 TaxID=3155639 RepID=UPI0033CC7ECB